MKELFLIGIVIGIFIILTLPMVESAIPPTRAYDKITTSNGTVFAFNSSAKVNFVGTGSATVTGSNNSKTVYVNVASTAGTLESLTNVTDTFCTTNQVRKAVSNQWVCADDLTGGGGAYVLNNLTDVTITAVSNGHILQYNGATAQWINKLFAINNQTVANDFQIVGINNQSGVITRNQFSVNTITCSGTDKVSAIDNVTGIVTCSTDQTGGASADKVGMAMVASADLSKTKTNIGTLYTDIYDQTTFEPHTHLINFTGYTHVKSLMYYDYVGSGTHQCKWAKLNDNVNVLLETVTFTTDQKPQISDWIALPAWTNNAETTVEWLCKSTTGTDDPVPKGFRLYLRNSN